MKKIFRMTMLLAMMAAACVSMGSCSSDDADGTFSEQQVEEYITGYNGISTTTSAASSASTATDWCRGLAIQK